MAEIDRDRALVFGEVADLYEAVRPEYPAQLFDDVIEWVPLQPGDPILESGAGTGKATREWVSRGLAVTAIEPSAAMARVGAATTPGATFVDSTFEDVPAEPASYALIAAAQSWHWVDGATGYPKAARLLRDGGALVTFWNLPWFPEGRDERVDEAYRRHFPELHKFENPYDRLVRGRAEFAASGVFGPVETRQYPWRATYTAQEWADLMLTHSDHRMLDPATRTALIADVVAAIEASGGTITAQYVTNLLMARPVR